MSNVFNFLKGRFHESSPRKALMNFVDFEVDAELVYVLEKYFSREDTSNVSPFCTHSAGADR